MMMMMLVGLASEDALDHHAWWREIAGNTC